MSLATLKKKSQTRYNNLSVGAKGFSLNGTHRSAGYIGQSTQSRHLTRTLMKGNVVRGNGGCCGTYTMTNIKPSELACLDDPTVVKPTVMNTEGMIHTKYKWFWSNGQTVKPDSQRHFTESYITERNAKKVIKCTALLNEFNLIENDGNQQKNISICSELPALARPRNPGLVNGTLRQRPICSVTKPYSTTINYETYLKKLDAQCTDDDQTPVSINCNCPLPV